MEEALKNTCNYVYLEKEVKYGTALYVLSRRKKYSTSLVLFVENKLKCVFLLVDSGRLRDYSL